MNNPLSKTPFLFLLVAIILGILLQYYVNNLTLSVLITLVGGVISLLSFLIKPIKQYSYRWLFGVGAFLVFISIGGFTTYIKQQSLDYIPNDSLQTYIGYVIDSPQEKPRSITYKIHLVNEDINIACYLQKDSTKVLPDIGDEILFVGELQAIKNFGNPNEFDYERHMYNQGFVASVYLNRSSWVLTGTTKQSLSILALKFRQKIMDLYGSLGFSDEEQAVLSALTLGYQDTLSDDIKQGFRTTGTVHVLSVSGLHVGIIYGMIAFLLSFIPRGSRFYRIKPLLIILLLWAYSFITGLPASVVRSSAMLTVFCFSEVFNKKSSSLNNLFLAAFFMLLYNPFQLFDIGFQLSCVSVLSILVLYLKVVTFLKPSNRVVKIIWNALVISLVAQLATFPICLYYFGTFPTYFFLANLIIVPLVSLIIYGIGVVILAWGIATLLSISSSIVWIFVRLVQFLVTAMFELIHLFESFPFALIEDVNFSLTELTIFFCIIIASLYAILQSNSKSLITSLAFAVLFLGFNLSSIFKTEPKRLVVYNRNNQTELIYYDHCVQEPLDSLLLSEVNPVIELHGRRILIVNEQPDYQKHSEKQYQVDYAIVVGDNFYSFSLLDRFYKIDTLIIDSSLKSYMRNQLTKECENRGVPLYDVTKKGAFSIFF